MSRFWLIATALAFLLFTGVAAHRTFTLSGDRFVRDGVPIQIKAGEIHYSRVPVEYWQDRLLRLRSMGLNAIQTYVPWNYHETRRGHFDFSSPGRDLAHFLGLANKLGLMVVVRAGRHSSRIQTATVHAQASSPGEERSRPLDGSHGSVGGGGLARSGDRLRLLREHAQVAVNQPDHGEQHSHHDTAVRKVVNI